MDALRLALLRAGIQRQAAEIERKLGIVLEDALRLKELYPQDIRSFLEALVS